MFQASTPVNALPPGEPGPCRSCMRIDASQVWSGRRGTLLLVGLALAASVHLVAKASGGADTSATPSTLMSGSASAFHRAFSSLSEWLHDLTPSRRAANRELLKAAERWDLNRVRELVTSGEANVNARNDSAGWTALFFAVYADDVETVRALLERGADVNIEAKEVGSIALATRAC